MKRFSEYINETCTPQIFSHGVTNHYTPVQNILTNVKNLFCLPLGIFARISSDGYSIELSSADFTTLDKTNELLCRPMYNDVMMAGTSTLKGYIMSQGLTKITMINTGSFFIVYFSPDDIRAAANPTDVPTDHLDLPAFANMKESLYDEFELSTILTEEDNTDDNKDTDDSKDDKKAEDSKSDDDMITNILNDTDKVKAANQLETIISQKISYPRDYYFAAIKFKNGDEAIAFRWKYAKELPTGNSTETTRSLLHIFGLGEKAIWVQDYATDSIVQLPDEAKKLVDNVLNALGAKKTSDPSIYSLGKSEEPTDDKNDSDDKDNPDDKDDSKDQNDKK